jgi:hypothetical protein
VHKILLIFSIALLFNQGYSQPDIKMEDFTYDDEVASIQVLVNDTITPIPIIRLKTDDQIHLQFDDLGDSEDNDYFYRIILCDRDWRQANVDPIEYVDGFHEERIRDWQNALGTFVPYTHYWLNFPNRDTRMKSSGNFILYVFNRYNDETPVFTRRFIVTENIAAISNQWTRPTMTDMVRMGQQLNLNVDVKSFKMPNPQRDVTMTIIRNGDWHDAKQGIKSRSFFNGNFAFDQFGQTSFLGINEYRAFDLRSLRGRGQGIMKMVKGPVMMEATLRPVLKRDVDYLFDFDFNGNYYIDNRDDVNRILFDNPTGNDRSQLSAFREIFKGIADDNSSGNFLNKRPSEWNIKDKDVRSDYVTVKFNFKSQPRDEKVYLYAAFTDFKMQPKFEMSYSAEDEGYVKEVVLKQGYYNYLVAIADKKGIPKFDLTEGSWQDTENDYRVLIYYKEYGTRIDRVIGVNTFNSSEFNY